MARITDMTQGKPIKLITLFALPLMLGNIFQELYTTADTIIVGRGVGVSALAAIGAAGVPNWFVVSIVIALTQGFTIRFAQLYGAKDLGKLRESMRNSLIISVIAVVLFTTAAQLCVHPLLTLLNTPQDIYAGTVTYLRYMFAGIPIVVAYNFTASLLRALGDSRNPFMAMILAALINIALDLLLSRCSTGVSSARRLLR